MGIYVNRTLNLKHIQAIGFDMDYTLVRYQSKAFEEMTYEEIKSKLLLSKGYPVEVKQLKFQYDRVIRGLVIDKYNGNLLKLSLYSKVKNSYHGLKELDFKTQQKIYQGLSIDLNDANRFSIVDTMFSMSYGVMFSQLVDLKNQKPELNLPDFKQMEADVLDALDMSHRDGSLKGEVKRQIKKYIIQEPQTVTLLEEFKKHGKKLWVITNSEFEYTKLLLDYTITPFLKDHKSWMDLFDIVVTAASKPRFFTDKLPFLKIDPENGSMTNFHSAVEKGLFQGGCAEKLQKDANLSGEQILYLGDHIYGDILSLKKACNWRTALVVEELGDEIEALKLTHKVTQEINSLMNKKIHLEQKLEREYDLSLGKRVKNRSNSVFSEIELIDKNLSKLIKQHQKHYNPYWGELMRAGVEPSRFAGQIEKYACIYMAKIADFIDYSPRTYFRPRKRPLPHEMPDL
jgi:HAD superfamily 5'-nucleotidase-like hydrolase